MMEIGIEGLEDKLFERRTLISILPPLVFWAVGVLSCAGSGYARTLWDDFCQLPTLSQIGIGILGLLVVGASALVVEHAQAPFLRLLEGYWPRWADKLSEKRRRHWQREIWQLNNDYDDLEATPGAAADPAIQREMIRTDLALAKLPADVQHVLPTELGNILRAAEAYSMVRYGLWSTVLWPHLYAVLPGEFRELLDSSRAKLDEMARLMLWSLLVLLWAPWQPWALLGIIVCLAAHRGALQDALTYGNLIRASFDLYRFDLYRTLRWPLPTQIGYEEEEGKALTEFVFRGTVDEVRFFDHPDDYA